MLEASEISRVNVVGCSGSGKSTLARRIAAILGHPYVEIDEVYWQPNWQAPPRETFLSDLKQALAGDCWVADGNYSGFVQIKWARVQVVVWLDLPFWQILWQVFTRTLRRSIYREVLWAGNQESLSKAFFSRDSILLWSLTHLKSVRRQYEAAMADTTFSHIRFVRLRSRKDIEAFIGSLRG